jgi:hypothetical protein
MKENSPNSEKTKFLTPRLGVSAVIIFHLLIALPLAYILNIWVDEASSLYTTENGLLQAFRNVFADEKQAPLYFLLLSLWREINHFCTDFFDRFQSSGDQGFLRFGAEAFRRKIRRFDHGSFRVSPVFDLGKSGNPRLFARYFAFGFAAEIVF